MLLEHTLVAGKNQKEQKTVVTSIDGKVVFIHPVIWFGLTQDSKGPCGEDSTVTQYSFQFKSSQFDRGMELLSKSDIEPQTRFQPLMY